MRDLVVVGGGIVGLSTAWAAARAGKRVTLVDPRPLLNEHNASNDESKIFRFAYGTQRAYAPLAKRALSGWRTLERESGDGGGRPRHKRPFPAVRGRRRVRHRP